MRANPSYPLGLPPSYPNDPHFYSVYTLNVGSVTLSPRACIPNEDDPDTWPTFLDLVQRSICADTLSLVLDARHTYLVANVAARPASAYKGTEAAHRIIQSCKLRRFLSSR